MYPPTPFFLDLSVTVSLLCPSLQITVVSYRNTLQSCFYRPNKQQQQQNPQGTRPTKKKVKKKII